MIAQLETYLPLAALVLGLFWLAWGLKIARTKYRRWVYRRSFPKRPPQTIQLNTGEPVTPVPTPNQD